MVQEKFNGENGVGQGKEGIQKGVNNTKDLLRT